MKSYVKGYKAFKLSKDWTISFSTFGKNAKKISDIYKLGIRNWESDDSYNYSLVLWRFRIILSKDKHIGYTFN